MNICAVRSMQSIKVATQYGEPDLTAPLEGDLLPHERDENVRTNLPGVIVDTAKELKLVQIQYCKHCNCLYREDV